MKRHCPSNLAVLNVLLAVVAGCTSSKPPAANRSPATQPAAELSSIDPCALRLHDLSGGLLLYFAQHGRMPANLNELQLPGGVAGAAEALVCPVSNQPYVFDPRGLNTPDGKLRLVIYDSTPAHHGRRWAIAVVEKEPGQPPTTDVVAVPEHAFAPPP